MPANADYGIAHGITLTTDGDGWHYAQCLCGWLSPPCPDVETVADSYGDHRAEVAQNDGSGPTR